MAKVISGVLVIGGTDGHYKQFSTVSFYNIDSDTWQGCMSKLNTARADASACVLKGIVYVFCGTVTGYPYCINSIEAISETLLVSKVKACWQLIETYEKQKPPTPPSRSVELFFRASSFVSLQTLMEIFLEFNGVL